MMCATWDAAFLLLLSAMWGALAGMMLPSAAPVMLLAARPVGRRDAVAERAAVRLYGLAGGYLFVWTAFSVGATGLQFALARLNLLTLMMEPASTGCHGCAAPGRRRLPDDAAERHVPAIVPESTRRPDGGGNSTAAGAFRTGVRHGLHSWAAAGRSCCCFRRRDEPVVILALRAGWPSRKRRNSVRRAHASLAPC